MFLSYYYRKYLGYDNKTKLYRWEYKIVDSEFEEIDVGENMGAGVGVGLGVGVAVINTYEKRNLNVAANLVRGFIWLSKKYGWPISDIVKCNKQDNPKFAKYEEQVNKYLILM